MSGVGEEALGSTVGHAGQGPTEVTAYTIDNGNGLVATIWNYGAHLISLEVPDRDGGTGEVVVRRGDTLADYEGSDRGGYMGATIGRYANRIAKGRLSIDGFEHRLATNDGPNHLHGGDVGFDQYVWRAEPFEESDACGVRLSHSSPDGDEGYPGRLDVVLTYSVDVTGALTFEYRGISDRSTVVNLTNHTYWNLAGGGLATGVGSALSHELQLASSEYFPVDATSIPRNRPQPVEGTVYDFRESRPIAESYDHCYLLSSDRSDGAAAQLIDAGTGRRMRVFTDQPSIQLYTGQHLGGAGPTNAGVCLEAQYVPDSPNRPQFGSPVVSPGQVYSQRTVHVFDCV